MGSVVSVAAVQQGNACRRLIADRGGVVQSTAGSLTNAATSTCRREAAGASSAQIILRRPEAFATADVESKHSLLSSLHHVSFSEASFPTGAIRAGFMAALETKASLFKRLGGESTIRDIVGVWYQAALVERSLAPFFRGVNLRVVRDTQVEMLGFILSSPTAHLGHDLAAMKGAEEQLQERHGVNDEHLRLGMKLLLDSLDGCAKHAGLNQVDVLEAHMVLNHARAILFAHLFDDEESPAERRLKSHESLAERTFRKLLSTRQ